MTRSASQASVLNSEAESLSEPARADPPVASTDENIDSLDRSLHAAIAQLTGGLSPATLALAFADWYLHLLAAPGKRASLADKAARAGIQIGQASIPSRAALQPWNLIKPEEADHRFAGADWQLPPFNLIAQSFLLSQQWWHSATTDVRGLVRSNAAIADFTLRQWLDAIAPTNFAWSNPEVLRKTFETGGANFVFGLQNWIEDMQSVVSGRKPASEQFVVGKDVGVSPGKVVYRNELIELIQYTPTTSTVRPEPVLIVPAWIMKYYILDLSPESSLVRFLVANGFTVFMISWKNPTASDRDLRLDHYRKLGVVAAIDFINTAMPSRRIHAVGYCLGGTLLSIAAASLSRDRRDCLRSVTLLAAQTDFTEAGELTLFINESQVSFLEDLMWKRGILDSSQMAGAFQMLRSNDLIWSRVVRHYLLGERSPPSEIMSWAADATRMPYRMQSDYLRQLFMNNDLAEGRYLADGKPIALSELRMPMFVVATLHDHIAPWKSTFKIHFLANADVTYVLANGGHNAGIVAPPAEAGHSYQVTTTAAAAPYVGPDEWIKLAPSHEGSWWNEWVGFLVAQSGAPVVPPQFGKDGKWLDDAPGHYVLQS
ncbi:MAG: polyhydroxyalkanoic acid synthase [Afipia sp.]|nr:polyhydroxyalkanoic acid synthase [Afipia sp.]